MPSLPARAGHSTRDAADVNKDQSREGAHVAEQQCCSGAISRLKTVVFIHKKIRFHDAK